MVEILVASLVRRFDAHITCVADTESCLDVDMVEPHDLVISELGLGGSDGLELAGKLMSLGERPIILLADDVTCDEAIEAMRLGVSDLLRKPFPIAHLLDTAEQLSRVHHLRQRHAVKYRRMRELVRRVIRERRDLNRRIELICRDLVRAHRRLVDRVLTFQEAKSNQPG